MLNTFDFYTIRITSTRKRDLKDHPRIRTKNRPSGYKHYKRKHYTADVRHLEAATSTQEAVQEALEHTKAAYPQCEVTAHYYARD